MLLYSQKTNYQNNLPGKTITLWSENVDSLMLRGLSVPVRFSAEP